MITGQITLSARTRPELGALIEDERRKHGPLVQLKRPYQVNGGWRVRGTLSVRSVEEEVSQAVATIERVGELVQRPGAKE